jgi:hypothetical protein
LTGGMRVGPERNPDSHVTSKAEQLCVDVLAVGIAVDLDGTVILSSAFEHTTPVSLKTKSKVEDPAAGMGEDVNGGVPQCCEVPFGLIVPNAQAGVECPQHQLKTLQEIRIQVALASRGKVHLDGPKDPEARRSKFVVETPNLLALDRELGLGHAVRDREPLGVISDRKVTESSTPCCPGHVANGLSAVATKGMNLKIGLHVLRARTAAQDVIALGSSEEPSAFGGWLWYLRWLPHPPTDDVGEPWPH